MTPWTDIQNDPNYIRVLDQGFVGLVDKMGTDSSIVQAARVSYGKGTKSVRQDRGLIRYLYSHQHMSPFEMCDIKFHVKLPLFVARQWIRHRMASVNEYSARYSEMDDEFYIPQLDQIQPQSESNHQGREGTFERVDAERLLNLLVDSNNASFESYHKLLGDEENPGLARELARTVLPTGHYTEFYWKQNLRSLFHLIKLRADSHAQYEIQEYARALFDITQKYFPIACEAFVDYHQEAKTYSRMEQELLKSIMLDENIDIGSFVEKKMASEGLSEKDFAEKFGMTKRELTEFRSKFN